MITTRPSGAERVAGTSAAEHRQIAVEALRTDGFLVLADVVDQAHLDVLLNPSALFVTAAMR